MSFLKPQVGIVLFGKTTGGQSVISPKHYSVIKSTIKYNNTKFKLKTNQTLTREIVYIYIYIYIL